MSGLTTIFHIKIRPLVQKWSGILSIKRKAIQRGNFCRQSSSLVRYNYNKECEEHINQQITLELFAGYFYLSLAFHFDQSSVSLPGFHKIFFKWSNEEFHHAHKFMYFQNKRGGQLSYANISAPPVCDWKPVQALEESINLEKTIMKSLDEMHEKGTKHNDQHLCDFIEGEYLVEQYEALMELQNLLTNTKRVGDGEGLFILDQAILKKLKDEAKNDDYKHEDSDDDDH